MKRALLLGALLSGARAEPGEEKVPQRVETLGLEATFDLPEGWGPEVVLRDPGKGEEEPLADLGFEVSRGWNNHGEILARVQLRLGRKEFKGTPKELADRCISDIRAKWPAFKAAKPSVTALALGATPAVYVALENRKEPPYRVHLVAFVAEGKGCGLFCYGWGPQVAVHNLSGEKLPDSVRKAAEEAARLTPEKLKRQAELFREFEKAIAPTLRVAPAKPKEAPPPAPPAR